MALLDSLDKIITRYFTAVTNQDFEWKGRVHKPKPLKLSPGLLRGYTCLENCGACCPRFSLDYLPAETHPYTLQPREVYYSGEKITIYSDLQKDHKDHHCRHLLKENARCQIHGIQPFSCDFELVRPLIFQESKTPNILTQKLFSRGWNMLRVDGERGALCHMTDPSPDSIDDVVRRIQRLNEGCLHFGLEDNKCGTILEWLAEVRSFVPRWNIAPRLIDGRTDRLIKQWRDM